MIKKENHVKSVAFSMKKTIFISHANPEDNYFAFWLASKLQQLGYDVWVDIKNLLGGDSFWPEIEHILRDQSVKFLAIVSKSYISKARTKGSGIRKEISCAQTLINDIPNFIIPVRIDNSDYKQFSIDLLELDAIDFHSQGWHQGLLKLTNDLKELNTPKSEKGRDVLQFWLEAMKIITKPDRKPEKYLTNWLDVKLPENIWLHRFDQNLCKASDLPYSNVELTANGFLSFASQNTVAQHISLLSSTEIAIKEFLRAEDLIIENEFAIKKPNRSLVALLNVAMRNYLICCGLDIYLQANNKEVFYFPFSENNAKRVSLARFGKSRRAVIGKAKDLVWHFAISCGAALYPTVSYRLFYHLVFSENGIPLPQEDQHALRRSIPSDWFNRKWLEILLAMLCKISNSASNDYFNIEVGDGQYIGVEINPLALTSEIGYHEPNNEQESFIS